MVPSSVEVDALKSTVKGAAGLGVAVKLATGGSAKAGLTGNVARRQRREDKNKKIFVFIQALHGCGYRFFGISHGDKVYHGLDGFGI